MAMPSKFTAETCETICEKVAMGLSETAACESADVSRQTLLAWKKLGAAADANPEHAAFLVDLTRAHADAEALYSGVIQRHADGAALAGDWRAAAFWLKCRRPEVYGDRVAVDHGVQDSAAERVRAALALLAEGDAP